MDPLSPFWSLTSDVKHAYLGSISFVVFGDKGMVVSYLLYEQVSQLKLNFRNASGLEPRPQYILFCRNIVGIAYSLDFAKEAEEPSL